jgi:hypothetical protein
MLTGSEFNSEPGGYRHDTVMNNVESANMIVLFPQHEEDCVRELDKLGEIIPPTGTSYA